MHQSVAHIGHVAKPTDWLHQVSEDVLAAYSALAEIERQLAQTGATTKTIKASRCGPLSCELRVVRYGPGQTHLEASLARTSVREWEGIQQAGLQGDLYETKRRFAVQKQRQTMCRLVWDRPLTLPPEVEARLRSRGEDAEAWHARVLAAWRRTSFGQEQGVILPPVATVPDVLLAMGLSLVQAGVLADTTVQSLLVTRMGVPGEVVKQVWKRLTRRYQAPQLAYTLRSYLKRLVADYVSSQRTQVVQDPISGEECLTIREVVKELR